MLNFKTKVSISWSMDKEDVGYIYSGILLGYKKEILLFTTTWMHLEGILLCEIGRERQRLFDITFM